MVSYNQRNVSRAAEMFRVHAVQLIASKLPEQIARCDKTFKLSLNVWT